MAKSISEMRKARGSYENLTKEIEKQNKKGYDKEDDRFWQCAVDKAGNGSAVIRFLPAPQGEDIPWVKMYTHGFKGPTGKWYIENSLTTIGQADPVTELNNELWSSKIKANEDIARAQKRKLNYYSNVLIISDPANPENEGKVKLFRYGAKIFDKLNAAMEPEFEDDPRFNPFDFWEGANFRLKITRVEKYANFDKSSLAAQSAVSDDDAELQKIWEQCHSLQAIIAPDQFKSYDELKKRLNFVLATSAPGKTAEQSEVSDEDQEFIRNQSNRTADRLKGASKTNDAPNADQFDDVPPFDADPAPAEKPKRQSAAKQVQEDADDDLEYFRKLAGE